MINDASPSLASIAAALLRIGDRLVRVWPEPQAVAPVADPRMHATLFPDHETINPLAKDLILRGGAGLTRAHRGSGGRKVRGREAWDAPELAVLTWRALVLVGVTHGVDAAHVVDRWANIMEHEEYSSAHSHYDSDLAVVYSLDPGEMSPLSGQLQLIDPRIPACCTSRPECPTRAIMPQMVAGAMLVFPAKFLHAVTPYEGHRPRITLAWNISLGPPPASGLPDPTQPCTGAVGLGR